MNSGLKLPVLKKLFFTNNFLSVFLTALGLHYCLRAFSSLGKWGLLVGCGVRASHCGGFSCFGAQALGGVGFGSGTRA